MFNCVALIGFFLLFVPLISLLLEVPFLKSSITEKVAPVAAPTTGIQKTAFWICIAASILYPAVFFTTLMDKQMAGLNVLTVLSVLALVGGVIIAVVSFRSGKKSQGIAGTAAAVAAAASILLFKLAPHILALGPIFSEPTTNQIAYWAVSCGMIALVILLMFFALSKKAAGTKSADYGVRLNIKAIAASFVTALCAVVIGYIILFVIEAIFGTDFRIWTLAVRTFKPEFIAAALRYMPFFFIYYLINTAAINANTRNRKCGYLIAILLNTGGLILWLLLQYGLDFARGVALYPNQALNGILLFATVPCLGVAAVYAKKLFEKTNNVWLAAFVNTMLFTMITVANTALFWNMV